MAISSGFILDAPSVTVGGNNNVRAVGVLFDEASNSVTSQVVVVPLGYVLYLSAYGPSHISEWAIVNKVTRGGSGVPTTGGQEGGWDLLLPTETILHSRQALGGSAGVSLTEYRPEGFLAYPGSYQVVLNDASLLGDVYVEFGVVPVTAVPHLSAAYIGFY